ncbi:hypothetical protein [Candidatus Odyssella acanthamoebae]|uniref:hypothetical protein n=1 Tax=Candidatus Odyssella acanthamoebae TaxID=91604 RepID=UPI0018DEB8AC|nr:hypothetical protein [Candidatus Paracaedibacter acanthamoebae]
MSSHLRKVKEGKDRPSILATVNIFWEIVMINPNLIILYVDNPLESASLYADLLETAPTDSHPTFVSFTLASGIMLGLWSKHTASPTALLMGGGGEIAFSVTDEEASSCNL